MSRIPTGSLSGVISIQETNFFSVLRSHASTPYKLNLRLGPIAEWVPFLALEYADIRNRNKASGNGSVHHRFVIGQTIWNFVFPELTPVGVSTGHLPIHFDPP